MNADHERGVGRMAVLVTAEDDEDIRMLVARSLRKADEGGCRPQ